MANQEHQERYTCDGCSKVSPWILQGEAVEGWAIPNWASPANGMIRVEVKNTFGSYVILCDECAGPIVEAFERSNQAEMEVRRH